RIDDVIVFNSLDKEHIFKIIDIELKSLFVRIEGLGYHIHLLDPAKEFIAETGFDLNLGRRRLRRAIQKYLEGRIAQEMLKGEDTEGSILEIDYNKDKEGIVGNVQCCDDNSEPADLAEEKKDD